MILRAQPDERSSHDEDREVLRAWVDRRSRSRDHARSAQAGEHNHRVCAGPRKLGTSLQSASRELPMLLRNDVNPGRTRGQKRVARSLAAIAVAAVMLLAPTIALGKSTTETLGDVGQVALPATGLAVSLLHKDKKGVVQLAEAFGTAMAVVYTLKPTVDRTRPNGGSQSFPSGHAASAFAGAAFLQIRYGWSYGVPAYAAATFVAY